MASPTIKLNSGADMPQVGFGLWKVDKAVAADTVYNAIKAGYRLFDGACGRFPLRSPCASISRSLVVAPGDRHGQCRDLESQLQAQWRESVL